MLIITAAGPLAIYVRYNLFFDPQAIEFIENIFQYLPVNLILTVIVFAVFAAVSGNLEICQCIGSGKYYCGMSDIRGDSDGRHDADGPRFPRSYPFMYFAVLAAGISVFRF